MLPVRLVVKGVGDRLPIPGGDWCVSASVRLGGLVGGAGGGLGVGGGSGADVVGLDELVVAAGGFQNPLRRDQGRRTGCHTGDQRGGGGGRQAGRHEASCGSHHAGNSAEGGCTDAQAGGAADEGRCRTTQEALLVARDVKCGNGDGFIHLKVFQR